MSTAVESVLSKHVDAGRDALIPVLQEVQDQEGYLSRDAVAEISRTLMVAAQSQLGDEQVECVYLFGTDYEHLTLADATALVGDLTRGSGRIDYEERPPE